MVRERALLHDESAVLVGGVEALAKLHAANAEMDALRAEFMTRLHGNPADETSASTPTPAGASAAAAAADDDDQRA